MLGEQHVGTVLSRIAVAVQDQIEQLPEELAKNALDAERISQQAYDAWTAGGHTQAEELFRQAIKLREALGERQLPFVTAQTNRWLAEVLQQQGKWAESEQPLMVAWQAYGEVFEGKNPTDDYANVARLLGRAFAQRGAHLEAIEQYNLSRELYGRIYGPDSDPALGVLYRIGAEYLALADYKQSLAAFREYRDMIARVDGKQSQQFAVALYKLADIETFTGNNAAARELYLQALEARKSAGDEQSLEYWDLLERVAACDGRLGNLDTCATAYATIIEHLRKIEDRGRLCSYLRNLAPIELKRGQFERAEQLALEATAIATELYDVQDANTRNAANVLMTLWSERIPVLQAEKKHQEVVTLRNRILTEHLKHYGPDSQFGPVYRLALETAQQVAAFPPEKQELYIAAVASLREALEQLGSSTSEEAAKNALAATAQFRQLFGDKSLKVCEALSVAVTCSTKLDEAQKLRREALEIAIALFGSDSLYAGQQHSGLAENLLATNRYREAVEEANAAQVVYQKNVQLLTASEQARPMLVLAEAHSAMGDLAAAQQSLAACEQLLIASQSSPAWFSLLRTRGWLANQLGNHVEMLRLQKLVYEGAVRLYPEKSPSRLQAEFVMATAYSVAGDLDSGQKLLESLAVTYREQGRQNSEVYAQVLLVLGLIAQQKQSFAEACTLLEESLALSAAHAGEQSSSYRSSLMRLATAYLDSNKLDAAEKAIRQSLDITKELEGVESRSYQAGLEFLAEILIKQDRMPEAAKIAEEGLQLAERRTLSVTNDWTESQLAAAMHEARRILSWYLQASYDLPELADSRYDHVLRLKGSIFARQRRLRVLRSDPAAAELLARWSRVTSSLATLALRLPYADEQNIWSQQVALISAEKDAIERQLLDMAKHQAVSIPTTAQLRKAIPKNAVLVDFYSQEIARTVDSQDATYIRAFIIRPEQSHAVQVSITETAQLEETIDRWRAALDWRRSDAAQKASDEEDDDALQALYVEAQKTQLETAAAIKKLLWEPLQQHLQGAELVIVSPDGPISKFPLSALPGEREGTYLIEEMAITSLAVPSLLPELLSEQPVSELPESLLLMGDVEYGGSAGLADLRGATLAATTRGWLPFSFSPLAGTRPEIDDILASFQQQFAEGKSQVFAKSDATESVFRREAPLNRSGHARLLRTEYFRGSESSSA